MERYKVYPLTLKSRKITKNMRREMLKWRCRQISQNIIILALMYHYFGGDIKGIHFATPFKTLYQVLIRLMNLVLMI